VAKVVFAKTAKYDLLDIEYYIFTELENPQAANRVSHGILNVAESLKLYPMRHALVNDEFLSEIGVRRVQFDNYNIFYYYDSESDIVYIIRILFNRVDWKNVLK
jgi:toxin ParE1/3/4